MFVDMTQLGQHAHVTGAKVIDAIVKLHNVREFIGGSICSAAVDNAVSSVAQAVIEKYAKECPEEPKMLRTRVPGQCIVLAAKSNAKVESFAKVLSATRDIIRFPFIDRISDIFDKAVRENRCVKVPHTCIPSDTQFTVQAM
jgi:DNA-binding FrmR family transcriptional regulator